MRIAFCIFKFFPHGGVSRDLMKMVREGLVRGHQVRVYAGRWEGPPQPDIDVVKVPVTALTSHRRYERFARWVHAHLSRHPVDLVVGMNKMPGLDVYYAADSCYREKAHAQRGALYRRTARYRHFVRFERAVFDPTVATQVLTISDVEVPSFQRHYGTPAERFHALPPGIDADRASGAERTPVRAGFRAEFSIADDEHLLLFLGSGFIKKGLDRLLRAFRSLPPELYHKTRLFVVGHDNARPFRRMARRLGIDARVRFFPGRDDVPRFLAGADGLVLPAYDENAGMVILEAMIAGLPALVTQNCGYASYLEAADAGLVCPLPFEQKVLDRQLVELLTSPRRSEWRQHGLALADDPNIYRLAQVAVDRFEEIAQRRRRVVAFELFKYFPFGGLQRDFLRVARACAERGHRVRVYTLEWQGEVPGGIDVIRVPVRALANHVRYRRFARWVAEDLSWRPAACVVGFNKLPGLDVYYAADPCFEEKTRALGRPLERLSGRYRTFAGFERAVFEPAAGTRILLITERQKAAFQRCYATPDERFRILPPGVSPERRPGEDAPQVRADLRGEFALGDQELLLLFVGSDFERKGLDRLLSAVAALPDALQDCVHLFVVGQDEPGRFAARARDLDIASRVRFLGGRDDMARFFLGADLLVHPARSESGGIVLLEAAIAGLPVIASDACGFAPYLEQAGAGVVLPEPFRQETLDAALSRALADPAQRREWSRNGIRYGLDDDIYEMPARAADAIEERMDV